MSEHKAPSEVEQIGRSNQASLVEMFHRVGSLVPGDQQLTTVEPKTRVADALKLMKQHRYSQLPVVVGTAVLGVFSYRSFSEKALTKQKSAKGNWLGELPVEDFLEEYEFVHVSQDWNRILGYLNQDDAFFVGNRNRLEGLVTTMDVLQYYREIATPFILLAEIELSLRSVITRSIDMQAWDEVIRRSLSAAYEGRAIPVSLDGMTFDNYVQIVSNSENWPYFEEVFESGDEYRKQTTEKLQQVRGWRNIVFHFRRPLETWELEALSDHREWLQRRVRTYQARLAQPSQPTAKSQGRTDSADPTPTSTREYLPRMDKLFEWGILKQGDRLSIKRRPNSTAVVIDEKFVEYKGQRMSYNDWCQWRE